MNRIVDLKEFDAVCANKVMIRRSMELNFNDANFMPVSRDLSPAKQRAILAWLENPTRGTPPPAPPFLPPVARGTELPGDGKDTAFARTLLQQHVEPPPSAE
jgi:hypothetical protein